MIIKWPLNGQLQDAVTDVLTSRTDIIEVVVNVGNVFFLLGSHLRLGQWEDDLDEGWLSLFVTTTHNKQQPIVLFTTLCSIMGLLEKFKIGFWKPYCRDCCCFAVCWTPLFKNTDIFTNFTEFTDFNTTIGGRHYVIHFKYTFNLLNTLFTVKKK